MAFLLDTNVVSEWVRPRPNSGVVAWLAAADEDAVFLSAVTIAELRFGIERLAPGRRRAQLEAWLRDDLAARFDGRILPVDIAVANAWGKLLARREAAGRPMRAMDGFIAATANAHGLALVTREALDFAGAVGEIVDPWR